MKDWILSTDNTRPFISIMQINASIEMLTDSPSELAKDIYNRDPLVHKLVRTIKGALSNKGVANNKFDLTTPTDCSDAFGCPHFINGEPSF